MTRLDFLRISSFAVLASTLGCGIDPTADAAALDAEFDDGTSHQHHFDPAHQWSAENPYMISQDGLGRWRTHIFPCEIFFSKEEMLATIEAEKGVLFY